MPNFLVGMALALKRASLGKVDLGTKFKMGVNSHEKDQWDVSRLGGDPEGSQTQLR